MQMFQGAAVVLAGSIFFVSASAQENPGLPDTPSGAANANPSQEDPIDSIVVRGTRLQGATIGNIEPELSIGEAEIEAYGAGNFGDLLEALEPSTSSGRGRGGGGRPIVLLNGVRVANFGEIRRYPTEALARVDVLSEEVAVQYGYRADQRVVNFVLKPGFKSLTAEIESEAPTAGGQHTATTELAWIQFGENRRTSIDAEYAVTSSLLERERDVLSSSPSQPFSLDGNIGAVEFGEEIDPALSALLGDTVTVAGIPTGADLDNLSVSDFVGTANVASETALGDFRTLRPENTSWSLGAAHSRTIFGNVAMTVSGSVDQSENESLLGLPTATLTAGAGNPFSPFSDDVAIFRYLDPSSVLMRDAENSEANVALTLAGNAARWRYNIVADYDIAESKTLTDRTADLTSLQASIDANDPAVNPFGALPDGIAVSRDRAETENTTAGFDATLNGFLFDMPAGPISATLRTNLRSRDFSTESTVAGTLSKIDLSRDTRTVRASIGIPIADRDADVLPFLGELSLDLQTDLEDLSDVGTLSTYSAGLRWSPIEKLRLSGSWREEEGAPSITQLGNPVIDTPNARVFDFTTGETVEVTRRSGGNTDLIDDSRTVIALGARYEFRENPDITLSTDYTDEQIDNPIAAFPTLTPEIEAAFADRFTRVDGDLTLVDVRPVNFQESSRRQLRTGLSFRKRLQGQTPTRPTGGRPGAEGRPDGQRGRPGGARPPSDGEGAPAGRPQSGGAAPQGRPPQAAGGQGRPAGASARAGGGRPGGGGGRPRGPGSRGNGGFLSISAFHTWRFEETILIRDGVPALDLLDGSAVGNFGGQPEHELQANLFYVMNGLGMRASARWQDGTFVAGDDTGLSATSDLEFSSLSTINARVFVNFDSRPRLKEKFPVLKGTRFAFEVNNIFDERIEVRDSTGDVPINYQPGLVDPVGRTIEVSIRKLFY